MKKLILLISVCLTQTVYAQTTENGYRGNVEAGYCHYISQFSPSTIANDAQSYTFFRKYARKKCSL